MLDGFVANPDEARALPEVEGIATGPSGSREAQCAVTNLEVEIDDEDALGRISRDVSTRARERDEGELSASAPKRPSGE